MWTWRNDRRRRARFEADLVPHIGALYRFACTLATASDAEDLVQTTCARALERFDAYREDTNLRAWLCTVLRNEFISGQRRAKRERDLQSGFAALPFPSTEPSLETLLIAQRWSGEIREALLALPEIYRTPLYLKDVEGFAYRDIARIVGCPLGTVMSRLSRGRSLLRAALLRQAAEQGLVRPERRKESV